MDPLISKYWCNFSVLSHWEPFMGWAYYFNMQWEKKDMEIGNIRSHNHNQKA